MTVEDALIDAVEPKLWAVATAPIESHALRRLLHEGWEPFSSYIIVQPIIVLRKLVG